MLRPDSARRWWRMTVHQMVCHLADNFRMAIGQRPVATTRVPVPRGLVKWVALYAPLPWPRGIPTAPETDQRRLGTRPVEFAADLAEAVALLERVAGAELERRARGGANCVERAAEASPREASHFSTGAPAATHFGPQVAQGAQQKAVAQPPASPPRRQSVRQ